MQAYRRDGLIGLLKHRRIARGSFDTHQVVRELIEGLALSQPRQSKAAIHRRAITFSRENGLNPPSCTTVRAIISGLGFPLNHLAHEGKKSFMDKYDLIFRRTTSIASEGFDTVHEMPQMPQRNRHSSQVSARGIGSTTLSVSFENGTWGPLRCSNVMLTLIPTYCTHN